MLDFIQNYINELWFLLLEMAPWLLLGLIFAGMLKVYFPQKHIDKYLGKNDFKSALNGSLLGIPMPLCSCGVIPTGISFYKNGASKGAANSFLISTPQTGIDSIFATYSMLGWPFALLRPVVALATGVMGGIFTNWFVKEKASKASSFENFKLDIGAINNSGAICNDEACGCSPAPQSESRHSLIRAVDYAFIELLQDIAKWLIIGFIAAAFISVVLPNDFFMRFQGLGLLEILIILLASVPIYICATGSIPIAAVLLMKGVSPGAALVFLMAGPATNVATMTVLGKTMGKKSLTIYLATIITGAILFGLLLNWLVPADFILSKIMHIHGSEEHEMLPQWMQLISALALIISMAGGYVFLFFRKKKRMNQTGGLTIKVEGMTCSHCEANVKNSLEKLKGISEVVANNQSNTVNISGTGYSLEKIKATINALGYRFIG